MPNNPAKPCTLPQAIEAEPKLQEARDSDPLVARLIEISIKLEGLYRHASTHAAGLVISDRFYLTHPDLHVLPLISIGGPGVNRLASKLLKKLPALMTSEGRFYIQMDPCWEETRVSIWGLDNAQTTMAVVTFAERFLQRFTEIAWQCNK